MSRTVRGGQSRRNIARAKQAEADARLEVDEVGDFENPVEVPEVEQSVEPLTLADVQESTTEPPAPAEVPVEEDQAGSPPPGEETAEVQEEAEA